MNFKQKKARITTDVQCVCYAKPVLFKEWDELPLSAKNEFKVNGPIPCGGGGVPGIWCENCRFGEVYSD